MAQFFKLRRRRPFIDSFGRIFHSHPHLFSDTIYVEIFGFLVIFPQQMNYTRGIYFVTFLNHDIQKFYFSTKIYFVISVTLNINLQLTDSKPRHLKAIEIKSRIAIHSRYLNSSVSNGKLDVIINQEYQPQCESTFVNGLR